MFKRLKHRILLLNMVILSLVMLLAFGSIYLLTYTNVQQENDRKLESSPVVLIVEDGIEDDTSESLSGMTLQPEESSALEQTTVRGTVMLPVDYSQSFTLLLKPDGALQEIQSAIDMPSHVYQRAAKIAQDSTDGAGTVELEERIWRYKTIKPDNSSVAQSEGELLETSDAALIRIVFLDVTDSIKSLHKLLLTFVAVGVLMLVVLFGISWFFASRTIKPMEENWDKQQRFIADASHELKTPLAIISANIDALRVSGALIEQDGPTEQDGSDARIVNGQSKWLDHVDAEVTRMSELIADLLYLAAAETETVQRDALSFNLAGVVESALASMEAVIFERDIILESSLTPDVLVRGDETHCKQVLLILLDNAAKYTTTGGTIHVSLVRAGNHAVCSVRNSGPDIPADKLPRIFDRFYRVDDARSSETGGYGLGLSIAKAIIERQGGQITATSFGGETTFSFMLKTL